MRADRLLSLLMLLQIRGQITAHELAQRLEVSERTIYRDLDALSVAGVPVYAERGPGGGCMLAEGYRTSLTGLTEPEVRSLFMPGTARPLADLGANSALEAALLKLLAVLPLVHQQDVEHTRQRLYLDAIGWTYNNERIPFLQTLRQAIWNDRKVRIIYRKSNGEVSERTLDPLALVAKAGFWYMVAVSKGEMRVFRVSRVREVVVLDVVCERPAGFDLERFWLKWCEEFHAQLPIYSVKLRVAPEYVARSSQLLGESMQHVLEEAGPADEEGWVTIELQFGCFEAARGCLLNWGTWVEVLEPPELREAVIARAAEIVAFYQVLGPSSGSRKNLSQPPLEGDDPTEKMKRSNGDVPGRGERAAEVI